MTRGGGGRSEGGGPVLFAPPPPPNVYPWSDRRSSPAAPATAGAAGEEKDCSECSEWAVFPRRSRRAQSPRGQIGGKNFFPPTQGTRARPRGHSKRGRFYKLGNGTAWEYWF
jgi:hypothetical protein